MSERYPDPKPGAAGDPRSSGGEAAVDLEPKPRLRRLSRTVFLGATLAGLVVLTFLSLRYSRESLGPAPEAPRPPGPVPLAAEQLERLRLPARPPELGELSRPEPEPAPQTHGTYTAATPAPVDRASPPPPPRGAPLAVSLPARGPRGGAPASESQAATGLTAAARALLAAGGPGAAPEGPDGGAPAADPRQLPKPATNRVRVELGEPLSRFELKAGTYIPAVLTQTLSSEIGGTVRARVALDVLDTTTARHLLIPRGTVALGRQIRQPLTGEGRVLLVWERLIFPDGRSLELSPEPAAGADGALGVPGRVDSHWGRRLGNAALLSLVGAGFQLSQPRRSGTDGAAPDSGQIAAGAVGLELGRLSQEILRQGVDLPPTVSLEPGARLHLLLTRDLAFDRPYTAAEPR